MLTQDERDQMIELFVSENPWPDPSDIMQTGIHQEIIDSIRNGLVTYTTGGWLDLVPTGKHN